MNFLVRFKNLEICLDEEEEVSNLEEEASMPIEELLAKYKSEGGLAIKRLKDGKFIFICFLCILYHCIILN